MHSIVLCVSYQEGNGQVRVLPHCSCMCCTANKNELPSSYPPRVPKTLLQSSTHLIIFDPGFYLLAQFFPTISQSIPKASPRWNKPIKQPARGAVAASLDPAAGHRSAARWDHLSHGPLASLSAPRSLREGKVAGGKKRSRMPGERLYDVTET